MTETKELIDKTVSCKNDKNDEDNNEWLTIRRVHNGIITKGRMFDHESGMYVITEYVWEYPDIGSYDDPNQRKGELNKIKDMFYYIYEFIGEIRGDTYSLNINIKKNED